MKKVATLILLSLAVTALIVGCGLVSGTAFISQEVDGEISTNTQGGPLRGGGALDETLTSVVVDLTDNADWQDFTVEGVEDGCLVCEIENRASTQVSGEVWVSVDADIVYTTTDQVRANGFRVFHGLVVAGGVGQTHTYTCQETLALVENLDLLVEAIQNGKFRAYGIGDQDSYSFTIRNLFIGMHVTGSL